MKVHWSYVYQTHQVTRLQDQVNTLKKNNDSLQKSTEDLMNKLKEVHIINVKFMFGLPVSFALNWFDIKSCCLRLKTIKPLWRRSTAMS